jgi:rod shape-determining protein MreD
MVTIHYPRSTITYSAMRWPAYFLLVYVAVGLQIGLGEFLRIGGAKPDLVLLAVIFITINAPRDAALLGAFGIGMLQDVVKLSPLGLYALAYSLVGTVMIRMQELVSRTHPLAHFGLALLGGTVAAMVVLIHGWIKGPAAPVGELMGGVLYTALLAPLVLAGLTAARKLFAFSRRRAY